MEMSCVLRSPGGGGWCRWVDQGRAGSPARTSLRRSHRPPRMPAEPAGSSGLHWIHQQAVELRRAELLRQLHRFDGTGDLASDAATGSGENPARRPRPRWLQLQCLPLHAAQHPGETEGLPGDPDACD